MSGISPGLFGRIWAETKGDRPMKDPEHARLQKFMLMHEDMHATWDALVSDPSTSLIVDGENVMLHVLMDAATEQGLESDRPPGLKQVFSMLVARGFDQGRSFHVLSQAMMHEFIEQAGRGRELEPASFLKRAFDYAKQAMEQGPG